MVELKCETPHDCVAVTISTFPTPDLNSFCDLKLNTTYHPEILQSVITGDQRKALRITIQESREKLRLLCEN